MREQIVSIFLAENTDFLNPPELVFFIHNLAFIWIEKNLYDFNFTLNSLEWLAKLKTELRLSQI